MIYESQLYHHGIRGQRWGKRNGPPYPLDRKAARQQKRADKKSGATKSKHRQKLEEKFKSQGMSTTEAEKLADRRIRNEKIIGGVAGASAAALVAYGTYKKVGQNYIDSVVKSGTDLQRISLFTDDSDLDSLYVSYKKGDKTKYKGLFANQMKMFDEQKIYNLNLQPSSDLKVASRNNAANAFLDLYKNDSSFRDSVQSQWATYNSGNIKFSPKKTAMFSKLKDASKLSDKDLMKYGYDAFNFGIVDHNESNAKAATQFYTKLKSMGYGAIVDMNDTKYSGYKAKKPLIVFEPSSLVQKSYKEMSTNEIKKNLNIVKAKNKGKQFLVEAGILSSGITANRAINKSRENRITSLRASGMTIEEIAKSLGMSTSAVSYYLKKGK